jgi:hypothetical protein
VFAEAFSEFPQAAKVNNALHPGLGRRLCELPRQPLVLLCILSPCRDHRVDEIICRGAIRELFAKLLDVRQISSHNLQAGFAAPRTLVELARIAHDAADSIASFEKHRYEPTTYITSGSRHEYA